MTTVAFIGIAHIHSPDFLKVAQGRADIRIKGIWDHDPARGQKAADDVGTRFVPDVTAILADPEISAVVIPREAAYRNAGIEAIYEGARHNTWAMPEGDHPRSGS